MPLLCSPSVQRTVLAVKVLPSGYSHRYVTAQSVNGEHSHWSICPAVFAESARPALPPHKDGLVYFPARWGGDGFMKVGWVWSLWEE
jgi:hypothetical protein